MARPLTHTHAHAGMHHTEPTESALMAQTYRDEDGLVKQLRGRVKHIEEKSLWVQGESKTNEDLLTPQAGQRAGHHPQPSGVVYPECALNWEFNWFSGIPPDFTEVVTSQTERVAGPAG